MRLTAVIDRFEEQIAVLLIGEDEIPVSWPRTALPEDVQEGDILQLTIAIDGEATQMARSEADNLLRQLLRKNQEV
ncbi:hypothetical protein SDC9_11361 [bioreactor metagenome]|uniref:DUF3006 domain-containing protein n=1 Tax=bioreactor metagenome TaxID=1076179 RepID=A0A644TGU2_9ZZZZ|nr:DUF3006 domain-containing protein [Negativicutes bacterium]